MAGNDAAAQAEWIARVLGMRPGGATVGAPDAHAPDAHAWKAAAQRFQAAVETVDAGIANLQSHLRSEPDPRLNRIAELGLNGVTGNHKVRVMAAVQGLQQAAPAQLPQQAAGLAKLARAFSDFLAADERVGLVDDNPFGIPVGVRGTLVPALADLAGIAEQQAA